MMSVDAREVVIRTEGLTKRFGDVAAVMDLNVTVRRGEIYAFLGRNGAGKSTTIRLMLALLRPTSGSVEILGYRMGPNVLRPLERIGSMVESAGAYGNLTVRENLDLQRKLLGLRRGAWVAEAVELCGLGEVLDRRVDTLSLGNKQRVGLGRALLNRPEILILDEPTNGLDPAGIADVRALLKRLAAERNTTVFLSSHILSEVQQLADTIGIIHRGRLLEEIGYEELRRRNREYLEIHVANTKRAAWALEEKCGVRDYVVHEDGVLRVYGGFDRAEAYNRALVEAGVGIISVHMSEERLEDHFMKLTAGEGNEQQSKLTSDDSRGNGS
jgi:bacitracin transport system ATP-binding protein